MPASISWPPASGLTTKIVPRKNAILQVSSSTIVHAPAALVFDAVLHIAEYPQWNTWVPSARILTQPKPAQSDIAPDDVSHMRIGSTMVFDVVMDVNKPDKINATPLKVVDICTPSAPTPYLPSELLEDPTFTEDLNKVYRVSWTGHGGAYAFGMSLERFHEVIILGKNECEVRTWEVMGGMLSRLVKMLYQDTLKEKVQLWCRDLKTHCEKKHIEAAQFS